jgi:S-adenosylmethionine uptake transporter
MSLPAVTTLYTTAPLMIVILSIFVLGERIKGYRWVAIIVGLIGAVIAANQTVAPANSDNMAANVIRLGR